MKKTTICKLNISLILCMILLVLNTNLWGQENPDSNSGISGEIAIGSRMKISESQENDDTIHTLDGSGNESEIEFKPLISGKLSYKLEDSKTKFYICKKRSSKFRIGMAQPVNDLGVLDLALQYSRGSVWKNPYLLNTDREDATKETSGILFSWNNIMESNVRGSYSFSNIDIENDVLGNTNPDLRRSGYLHTLGAEYQIFLNPNNFFTPSFKLARGEMEGDVFSFNSMELAGTYTYLNTSFMVSLMLSYEIKKYEKSHPIFNQTREDDTLDAMFVVTKFNALGFEHISLTGFTGISFTDSNIDFHDEQSLQIGIELGYQF